jgi:large subunit ribosomal protein L23
MKEFEEMNTREVVTHPLVSEDSVNLIEAENKITFIVSLKASKSDVKRAVEELYEVQVSDVHTVITSRGIKKAYVRLAPQYKAADLAVKLGIL